MSNDSRGRKYERGADLEFDRVWYFSDAVYAIALTLLVLDLGVPVLQNGKDAGDLLDALNDRLPQLASFALAFFFIARYWLAHHAFVAMLRRVNTGLIVRNLCYLAFIVFLPFPTGLFGRYEDNPISVLLFGLTLAMISAFEVVMLDYSWQARLLKRDMPSDVFHWGRLASILPVLLILVTLPLALINASVTPLLWLLILPLEALIDRRKPADAEEYFP